MYQLEELPPQGDFFPTEGRGRFLKYQCVFCAGGHSGPRMKWLRKISESIAGKSKLHPQYYMNQITLSRWKGGVQLRACDGILALIFLF